MKAKKQKSRQQRNRQSGLCGCGAEPEPGITRCRRCQNRVNKAIANWKQSNATNGLCRCGKELKSKTKCQECLDRQLQLNMSNFVAALDAYGGRVCACCKIEILRFLTLDHIENDGYKTKHLGGGEVLYARLKKEGYPSGFQPLCFNCNLGKARNGGVCPHQSRTEWLDASGFTGSHEWRMEKLAKRRRFLDAIKHYSESCSCCGEPNPFFLTFDHIHNDGSAHRDSFGLNIVTWLRKNNFPRTVRVMCVNCNSGRSRNGGVCPHGDIICTENTRREIISC